MKVKAENLERKKKILLAATAIAVGTYALRSWKFEGDDVTIDVSLWGEKTKSIITEIIDDSKQLAGRLAGKLVIGPNNEILDVVPEDATDFSDASYDAIETALADRRGWSGQIEE